MRRRPLCLVWIGLMLAIWILKTAGAPIFGAPVLDSADCAMLNGVQDNDSLYLLPEGGAKLQVRGRIRSRKETKASFQYVLNDVRITQIAQVTQIPQSTQITENDSDQKINSNTLNTLDSDESHAGNSRSVYFPYLLLTTEKDTICRIGARVQGTGIIRRIEAAGNPGQFDARRYYACMKLYYSMRCEKLTVLEQGGGPAEWISLLRNRLTQNLKQLLPEDSAGVLAGMLLGERALLDEEIRRDYQIGGIMHILAISGLHISMLGMGLFMLLQYLYLPMPVSAAAASVFMAVYCLLVGNPSSAARAIVMFAVTMGAWITKRSYDMLSALSLAGILILLTNPGYLFLAGFQLSFAAVIGTSAADRILHNVEKRWKGLRLLQGKGPVKPDTLFRRAGFYMLRAVCSYVVMTLITMPLIAYYYYEIPVFGFFANLLILPLTGPVLALGAAGCAASLFSFFLAGVVLFPVHICLGCMNGLLHFLRVVPGSVWICGQPSVLQVLVYYILLAIALGLLNRSLQSIPASDNVKRNRSGDDLQKGPTDTLQRRCELGRSEKKNRGKAGLTGCLILTAAILLLLYRPAAAFTFTALDVGQGDGLVVRTGCKAVFLVDGGSTSVDEVGKYRIIPYLKQQGIRKIDGIWISHEDQDHISGIMELLQAVSDGSLFLKVHALYLPGWMKGTETDELFRELCKDTETAVRYVSRGDSLTTDVLQIKVLYPLRETAAGGNEGSMVLRVSYRTFDVLLTGDLEGSGEEELLAEEMRSDDASEKLQGIECLKVAHHGSRNASTEEFLNLVHPKLAVISCGVNNRYGHPHADTLERLAAYGADVFRNDTGGAVTVAVGQKKGSLQVKVHTFRVPESKSISQV